MNNDAFRALGLLAGIGLGHAKAEKEKHLAQVGKLQEDYDRKWGFLGKLASDPNSPPELRMGAQKDMENMVPPTSQTTGGVPILGSIPGFNLIPGVAPTETAVQPPPKEPSALPSDAQGWNSVKFVAEQNKKEHNRAWYEIELKKLDLFNLRLKAAAAQDPVLKAQIALLAQKDALIKNTNTPADVLSQALADKEAIQQEIYGRLGMRTEDQFQAPGFFDKAVAFFSGKEPAQKGIITLTPQRKAGEKGGGPTERKGQKTKAQMMEWGKAQGYKEEDIKKQAWYKSAAD